MASFKGVGFPWSKRSTSHGKPATPFPIASALLALAFSATPFTHRAATAQASADERTIVMCETPSAAVRVYEKEGDVLMRAYSRTQNSLLINNIPTDIQSLAEGTAYQNPQGEITITVSANDTTEDCTIQVADQPAEPGRILERGAPATLIETVEPETPSPETPDTGAPDTETPDMEMPGTETPGSEAPDMEDSETAATAVTGSVLYLPRIALQPGAVVQVKLLDISLADAPAVTVAEQTIVTTGEQVPIPYSLPYADSDINPSATYVVSADILIDNQLSWTTDTQYPVLTQGAPSEIDVVLVMTDSTDTPEPPPVEPTPEPTPEPVEPEPVEPEPTEPEPTEPEPTTPEPTEPEPTEPEPTTPEPTEPEAALPNEVEMAVKAALASEISDTATTVESYSQQTWSDGCLGLGGPAEACLAALTEGWQVILVDADTGDRYTYRTNQDGSTVRRDEDAPPMSN